MSSDTETSCLREYVSRNHRDKKIRTLDKYATELLASVTTTHHIYAIIVQKEVDRPTRLLQFVAFVHLPFSFRSLDLFVASLLFRKGTSFCVIRRK